MREHADQRIDVKWLWELVLSAHALHEENPELAVLAVQVAVETCAERVFKELLLARGFGSLVQPLIECLPDKSFMDKRTQKLWAELTATEVKSAATWKSYHRHVERRNRVAHAGLRPSPEEALESFDACRKFVGFLLDVLDTTTAPGPLTPP